ncbi:hypothetical protein H1R20_g12531, partial [Candolleomyces eurysporus]
MKRPLEERLEALYQLQQEGIDLVLWVDGTACRVAWPLNDLGVKVHERDIGEWLRDRNLVWTCLCDDDDDPQIKAIALIYNEVDGDTFLRCGNALEPCKFEVNLSAVRRRTDLTNEYDNIEPGQNEIEYCDEIGVNSTWACVEDDMGVEDVEATYEGWCGLYDGQMMQREEGHL